MWGRAVVVVVVDGEGTEVGAEKDPGPVRGIIYVRPQLDNKRIQDPRVLPNWEGGKTKKARQPQSRSRRGITGR